MSEVRGTMSPQRLYIMILTAIVLPAIMVYGQDSTYLVKAGEQPAKVIPLKAQYQYPDFRNGILFFPKGKKSEILSLNFNILYSEIQFIDTKGDTVFLDANANIVEFARIDEDVYFHDYKQGYFLLLTKEMPVRLMVRRQWNIVRRETLVNNGYGVSTAESNSARSARRSSDNSYITSNENVHFKKESNYFFLGLKNKIYNATKSSLNKLYPEHKKAIQTFISENNVNFGNESDLANIISYCNSLASGTKPAK